jgi:hypothetical protein
MIQVSHIQGHEIRIVSYALLDGGDCRSIEVDYVVYILTYLSELRRDFASIGITYAVFRIAKSRLRQFGEFC